MDGDYKVVDAQTSLSVDCNCPYCDNYIDILDQVSEVMGGDLRAEDIESEVICPECSKCFIVNNIQY